MNVAKKPGPIYTCLECGRSGHPRQMVIMATIGDHEMANGRVKVGDVHLKAPVCRFCHDERTGKDAS